MGREFKKRLARSDAGQARAADLRRPALGSRPVPWQAPADIRGSNRLDRPYFEAGTDLPAHEEVLYDVDLPVFRQPALDAQD